MGFGAARPRFKELGLRGLSGYVWGRSASLGEPDPAVVVAAFGVFEPGFVVDGCLAGRAAASRDDVLDARASGAAAGLAEVLGDDPAVATVGDVLLDALGGLALTARPLFA